ncbi:hypothetical protein V1509DRAFT_615248 [Lipomyces kononenkoae]
MVPPSPVSVSPVSTPAPATLASAGTNASQPIIYNTALSGLPAAAIHPKRKPLPPTVGVNTLSTLSSGRFPGGGPPSPVRHVQVASPSTHASPAPILGSSAQVQSTTPYLEKAPTSSAQSQPRPQVTNNHRYADTIPLASSAENIIPPRMLRPQSQDNRDSKFGTQSGAAILAGYPSLRPPPGVLAATVTESASTKYISRSSTESSGSSRSLPIQESPLLPRQVRQGQFHTGLQQRGSTASTLSNNSISSMASVSAKSGVSSASLNFTAGALTDSVVSYGSQFSDHTISTTTSRLPNASDVAPSNDQLVDGKKADYVRYLRRQRATVWSDRMQRDLLTKQRQGHHHKDKERKKSREDEYSTYTHAYAYYHPKLDMTLELSDARVMSETPSTKLASQASDIALDDSIEIRTDKVEEKAAEESSITEYPVTEAPKEHLPTEVHVNWGNTVTGDDRSNLVSDKVASSQVTAMSNSSLRSVSSDATTTNNTANTVESPATAISHEEELTRRLSVGSLDERAIAPRRTLYIVNPDYSSSDED